MVSVLPDDSKIVESNLYLDVRGDRNDLNLQKGGEKLIQDVAKGCGKGEGDVVVVVHSVGPVILEKFIDLPNVKAALIAHLPGQESGNAIVDVLFGDINPSGRLPYTIGKDENDYGPGSKVKYLPGTSDSLAPQQNFSEGLYIDYRHFDKAEIAPRYEFGFGLSYTTFKLSSLLIQGLHAKSPLPASRPAAIIAPPSYPTTVPAPDSALFPADFHKVERYIYPYLTSTSGLTFSPAPAPPQSPLSPAGGGPGGNPDLFTPMMRVSASVTNTGARAGSSVVQLYISFPPSYRDAETNAPVDFPVRVLRAFEKVRLGPHAGDGGKGADKAQVVFELTRRDLSYWDVGRQNWVMPQGVFEVHVGFSSRDLPLQGTW